MEDQMLAPIVAIRAVNFITEMNGLTMTRYEIQCRRQDSDVWEVVQCHDVHGLTEEG